MNALIVKLKYPFEALKRSLKTFPERCSMVYLAAEHGPEYRSKVRKTFVLLFYTILERSYILLAHMNNYERIIFYDHHYLLFGSAGLSLQVLGMFVYSVHMFERYMLSLDRKLSQIFMNILHRKSARISVEECLLRKYACIDENKLQSMFHIITVSMLSMYAGDLFLWPLLWKKLLESICVRHCIISSCLSLTMFVINSSVYYRIYFVLFHVGSFTAYFVICFLFLLNNLFKRLFYSIKHGSADLLTLRHEYVQAMLLFFRVNSFFGVSLGYLIITLTPPHAFLLQSILLGADTFNISSLAALLTISIDLIMIHYAFSTLGSVIGRPLGILHGKFLNDSVASKDRISRMTLRRKLVMSHFMADLGSGYGFNYGKLGIAVSVHSFKTYIFLYFRIMVLSHKLMQK